jgi:predicted class III extradiol MEMO1 family dioxygenase
MSSVRRATHAGSWYSGNKETLSAQMDKFLAAVPASTEHYSQLPVPGARFLVGP